jgi:hypothetical protein
LGKAPKLFELQSCGITRGAHGEVFSFGVSNPLIATFYCLFSIHPAIADGDLLGIDGLSVETHGLGACCGKPVVFALRGSDFRLAGGRPAWRAIGITHIPALFGKGFFHEAVQFLLRGEIQRWIGKVSLILISRHA